MPEQQMGPVKINRVETPTTTYFFEHQNGQVFTATAKEAWNIYCGRVQMAGYRPERPKLVGTSTGEIYFNAVNESHRIFRETGDIARAQQILRDGFNAELEEARKHPTPPPNMDTHKK